MIPDTFAGGAPVAGIIAGMIAGSFLATLAVRWPAGRSVARGRSACDGCGVAIPAWRLLPLASYLAQRSRAACCGMRIDWRHPALEAGCAAIGGLALAVAPGPAGWAGALFGWILATLALLDAEHFWLPDALTLPLVAAGLAAGAAGWPPSLVDRVAGAAAAFLTLKTIASVYRQTRGRVGLGGGDAKLLAAIGAWLGWRPLPWVVLGACALGIGWALLAGKRRQDRLPLGTLLAISAWAAWLLVAAQA